MSIKKDDPKKVARKSRRLTIIDLIIILGVVTGLSLFYRLSVDRVNSLEEQVQAQKQQTKDIGKVVFFDETNKRNVEIIVEISKNEFDQSKGLMFREELPENQGMLFLYDAADIRYFWMKNTKVSLDIIYIDATFNIVKIHKDTKPYSEQLYPSEFPTQFVVEVRAGFTERYQIKVGQRISWEYL